MTPWHPSVKASTRRAPRKLLKRAERQGVDLHNYRRKWGPGPWDSERDFVLWKHLGLRCQIRRQPRMGHWCGYVAVERGHPLFGFGYDDAELRAPGGITYAEPCNDWVGRKGAGAAWWFGFDCSHCSDQSPGMLAAFRGPMLGASDATYKSQEFVYLATELLAEQLAGRSRLWMVRDDGSARETIDASTLLARRCEAAGCNEMPVNIEDRRCPIHQLRFLAGELHRLDPKGFPAPPTMPF